jgi:hypothetical protein
MLSSADPTAAVGVDIDGTGDDELVVDFGQKGLWLWGNGPWQLLTGTDPGSVIGAQFDADAAEEIVFELFAMAIWVWNEGVLKSIN